MKKLLIIFFLPLHGFAQSPSESEIAQWNNRAKSITIIRDQWGIPHVFGKTDADCVFGLMYAECEDDFSRVEANYIEKLGRMAEVKGETEIYTDLLNRLVIDSAEAIADYKEAPAWLKKLLDAFSDGINYYLYKNPQTKPKLLLRFLPWLPLLWTDGSIGAINTGGISIRELKSFYSSSHDDVSAEEEEETLPLGSNGFAIAPSNSASGHSMLYINPHTSFYFRCEAQINSEEGLNSYGAVTWGQFFVYQGFNEHGGWMHTSSDVDVADLYIEKITRKGDELFYLYDGKEWPVKVKNIQIAYRIGDSLSTRIIPAFFTGHGPVMASRNGEWISMKANNRDMKGLIQSWLRIKTTSFTEFKKVLEIRANTSNNTVYADGEGNIAYWHGNFIPKRDKNLDWSKPVDGTISSTNWKGLHELQEIVHEYNPGSGWIQNCNSTPFTVSGKYSPKKSDFPEYMAPDEENFRGINAVRVLSRENSFTLDKLIDAGYDRYLSAFEHLIPALVKAIAGGKGNDSTSQDLKEAVNLLKAWDLKCGLSSIATTLAVEWGQRLNPAIAKYHIHGTDLVEATKEFALKASATELLDPLQAVIRDLQNAFGDWRVSWGTLNRYQRLNDSIDLQFDDHAPSMPVGLTSSVWGCLPSFATRYFPGNKLRYGINGNSFVCAVEFGKKIKAKSLLTGGESGNPASRHFSDQAQMYVSGKFKDVLFYKEDIVAHSEKTYHPGE
jgi:acyl-homoserine lactone acylase PvdQ